MRPHQLSDELEKFLHDQSTVGAAAWNRLFDETMAGLEFPVEGEDEPLGLESTLNLLTDRDRDRREAGARALAEVFGANIRLFARVSNYARQGKGYLRSLASTCPARCRAAIWQTRCAPEGVQGVRAMPNCRGPYRASRTAH